MIETIQIFANTTRDIEGDINSFSIRTILFAVLTLVVLLVIASFIVKNKKLHALKTPLFAMIAATIVLPSLFLIGSTIYINAISESKGPVHWHTDIEFWVCGEEIELRNPYAFLSNKIGTATYHEHDDKRIHLEGVVIEKAYDASLDKFMTVTEGAITEDSITIATEDFIFETDDTDGDVPSGNQEAVRNLLARDDEGKAVIKAQNGQTCGGSEPAELQVFLFRYNTDNNTYTQEKLADPASYVMRDESVVPPGDCLIVEFDVRKNYSDRLCQQYGVRDVERCTEFGVSEFNPELCNIKEVRPELPEATLPAVTEFEPIITEEFCVDGEELCSSTPTTIEGGSL